LKVALDVKELSSLSIASTTAAAANTTAAATVAINDVTALPSPMTPPSSPLAVVCAAIEIERMSMSRA